MNDYLIYKLRNLHSSVRKRSRDLADRARNQPLAVLVLVIDTD